MVAYPGCHMRLASAGKRLRQGKAIWTRQGEKIGEMRKRYFFEETNSAIYGKQRT